MPLRLLMLHDSEGRSHKKKKQYYFINYLKTKHQWSEDIFNKIHWKAMERTLQTYKKPLYLNIIQLIHDWQNTGEQKSWFLTSKYRAKANKHKKLEAKGGRKQSKVQGNGKGARSRTTREHDLLPSKH